MQGAGQSSGKREGSGQGSGKRLEQALLPWASTRLCRTPPGLRCCQWSFDMLTHGRHWTGFRIGILDVRFPAPFPPPRSLRARLSCPLHVFLPPSLCIF